MHHNASACYMTMMHNSLPSPEYTGDSDSDSSIVLELDLKRRQLDEEIARFTARKDKEFRDFEADLRSRRQQRKPKQLHGNHDVNNFYEFTRNSPSATPPTHPLIAGREKKIRSPHKTSPAVQTEPMRLIKPNIGPKATPPTICLDKMNIESQNVLASHARPARSHATVPITSSSAAKDGPTPDANIVLEKGESDSASIRSEPLFTPDEKTKTQALAGFFVPNYLPLLDSRHDRSFISIEGTQTEPTSPTEPSMIGSTLPPQSSSLPTESSVSEKFQIPSAKRAYTSPSAVNRKILPPIIRNVNGRKRSEGKRKHVTFQLADRAIVEPSSSYEEGPSPDPETDPAGRKDSTDSEASTSSTESHNNQRPAVMQRRNTPLDPFGRRKRTITPVETPDSEVGMSMADLLLGGNDDSQASPSRVAPSDADKGYFSLHHERPHGSLAPASTLSPTSPSPDKPATFGSVDDNAYQHKRKSLLVHQKLERRSSRSPKTSPTVSRQGSFDRQPGYTPKSPRFSPHHSPITRALQKQYPGTLEDDLLLGTGNVGFFELDEELSSPTATNRPTVEEIEEIRDAEDHKHAKSDVDASETIQTGTSVPINIIRPGSWSVTNSWIGTFGH